MRPIWSDRRTSHELARETRCRGVYMRVSLDGHGIWEITFRWPFARRKSEVKGSDLQDGLIGIGITGSKPNLRIRLQASSQRCENEGLASN
jgi:hypothetical protein